jgi:phosphoribosylformylglycinamidine synthase subunit PurL
VTEKPNMVITQHGELVADIPNKSLTDDAPLYHRPVGVWKAPVPLDPPAHVLEELKKPRDYTADLKKLLASANICDKRWVFEQYDSMVQTNTVQGPGGEAGVMRIKGTGTPGHERGLAMALAGNGRWTYLDPKLGAMHAVAEAARKVACTGATPVSATNCLNFGNPEKPEIMAQLSAAIDGIAEACNALGTPVTGGNVSLYNETKGEGIYPTPVLGIVGIIEDVTKAVANGFQNADDLILQWQPYGAEWNEEKDRWEFEPTFGSSEYARVIFGHLWGKPPGIFPEYDRRVNDLLVRLASEGLLKSVSDVGSGGVAVALAKACIQSSLGARIPDGGSGRTNTAMSLFGESACNLLLSCSPRSLERIKTLFSEAKLGGLRQIGLTTAAPMLEILVGGGSVISISLDELKGSFAGSLESLLAGEVVTA